MDWRVWLVCIGLVGVLVGAGSEPGVAIGADQSAVDSAAVPEVEVVLGLERATVKGVPAVATAENTSRALFAVRRPSPDFIEVKESGRNEWRCVLKLGKLYVVGWISDEMFGYLSEPFVAKEGLRVAFSPGMPATFEYDLRRPPRDVEVVPAEVMLQREITHEGRRTFLSWAMPEKVKKPSVLKIKGLAAGTYQISARTAENSRHLESHTPMLYEDRVVEIKPGAVNRFEPNYPEIDTTVEPGDLTVRGVVYGPEGKPLKQKTVCLTPSPERRMDLKLYYPAVMTDEQGRFEFTGVGPDMGMVLWCEKQALMLRPAWAGDDATISVDLVVGRTKLDIQVGKPIGDITIDWRDGQVGRLSDLAGKIVVLDFWATWCGPCIRSLPDLNALADRYARRPDVVFVTVSMDYIREVWEKKVDAAGWTALRHGWQDRQKNLAGYQGGIPYCLVIDKDGVVRAEGHFLDVKPEVDRILESAGR